MMNKFNFDVDRFVRNLNYYLFFQISFMVMLMLFLLGPEGFDKFQTMVYIFMIVILMLIALKQVVMMDIWYFGIGSMMVVTMNFIEIQITLSQVLGIIVIILGISIDVVRAFKKNVQTK